MQISYRKREMRMILNPAIKPLLRLCGVVIIAIVLACYGVKVYNHFFPKKPVRGQVINTPAHNPTTDVQHLVPNAVSQVDVPHIIPKPGLDTTQHVVVTGDGNTVTVNTEKISLGFRFQPIAIGGYSYGDGLLGGVGAHVFQFWRLDTDLFCLTNFKMVALGVGESFLVDNNMTVGIGIDLNKNIIGYISLKL